MNTKAGILATMLAALLALAAATPTAAATVSSLRAPLGTGGANGYATLVATSTGIGTLRVVAKRLTARATYPVELRSGSCTGPRLFALGSTVAASTGTIVKSYALTAVRISQATSAAKLYLRIGSSTRVRCGRFALVIPTGATTGMTVKVPASPYGDAAHLHTVQAFENWTDPAGIWTPAPGNVFVTALVRIDALGPMSYNLFDYRVRDTNGLQYLPTMGRDPGLGGGDLIAGGFVAGWLTFEVPAPQASSLTLVYSPSSGITVLVKLTPLPTSAPTPTPTPTPEPCVSGCIGQTSTFGGYSITVDSVAKWEGATPGAGRAFVAVHVTETVDGQVEPPTSVAFTIISNGGGSIVSPGQTPNLVQPTGIQPTPRTFGGYVTFDVPAAMAGSLYMKINGSVVIRLF